MDQELFNKFNRSGVSRDFGIDWDESKSIYLTGDLEVKQQWNKGLSQGTYRDGLSEEGKSRGCFFKTESTSHGNTYRLDSYLEILNMSLVNRLSE